MSAVTCHYLHAPGLIRPDRNRDFISGEYHRMIYRKAYHSRQVDFGDRAEYV